jgi:hypothetical protein
MIPITWVTFTNAKARETTYLVKLLTCCDLDIFILFSSGTFKLDDWCLLWQYDWCALFDITPLLQLSKPGGKKVSQGNRNE